MINKWGTKTQLSITVKELDIMSFMNHSFSIKKMTLLAD